MGKTRASKLIATAGLIPCFETELSKDSRCHLNVIGDDVDPATDLAQPQDVSHVLCCQDELGFVASVVDRQPLLDSAWQKVN